MINACLQMLADRSRMRTAARHLATAHQELALHETVKDTIGLPWSDMIPRAVFWLFGPAVWALLALVWWTW